MSSTEAGAQRLRLSASIIVIGDEILGGFVQDTNSGWLAQRFQAIGIELTRIQTVPDTFEAIDEALRQELARSRPRVIVTTGGIGSTPDDVTYEAVAASLGRELEVADAVARSVDGAVTWTREQGLDVDAEFVDHMMRMAQLPAGATLLRPAHAFAPGVRVDVDGGIDTDGGASIVILPGVPSLVRGIFADVVEPTMLAGRGHAEAVAELAHGYPESVLNRCFVRLAERYPDVHLGSYPGAPMIVRLKGDAVRVDAAMAELRAFVAELEAGPAGARLRDAWADRSGTSDGT